MADVELRRPRSDECAQLSDLCFRSKAYWGYNAQFLEQCHAELAVTTKTMNAGFAAVATLNDMPVGYCELVPDGSDLILEKLFIDTGHIGSGIGRTLFDAMLAYAANSSAERILIDSDPEAEKFYLSTGAQRIGETPSLSIAGRTLPQLEMRLPAVKSK